MKFSPAVNEHIDW